MLSIENSNSLSYVIKTTWDNKSIEANDYVTIQLGYNCSDLEINIDAPFYDDPSLPDWRENPRTFPKLYDFEVVEIFLLNDRTKNYLEIELGPKGQYLLLHLSGYRNVTCESIPLKSYETKIKEGHWFGRAFVNDEDLPEDFDRFNAYAIHGSNEQRRYLALFPVEENDPNHLKPDFHLLEQFKPIDLFRSDSS